MSRRYRGGFITANPVAPTSSAASGAWTLPQQMQLQNAGTWPGPPVPDTYWSYVSLLMSTTSLNSGQNNTFLDSSTNSFTITRNGNPTQGSFTPYGSYWSGYFDGSGDYLSGPTNSAFDFGSGDFTVEAWICMTALPSLNASSERVGSVMAYTGGTVTANQGWEFYVNTTTNQLSFSSWGTANRAVCSFTITLGTWYHVAATRSGGTARLFINGVSQTLTTNSLQTNTDANANIRVGTSRGDTGYDHDFPGYISNARIVKGTAVYTATFTPSDTPLTAISGTSLLTCQSNRFVDNSSNAFAITANGNVRVQQFSPFTLPYPGYTVSNNGGSAYFDGSGDYLTAPSNAAFGIGTGDYTIEAWVYKTSSSRMMVIAIASAGLSIAISASGDIEVCRALVAIDFTFTAGITNNTWTHIAVSRSGTTLRAFKDGVSLGSQTSSTSYGQSTCYVGIDADASSTPFSGYISNLRLVKGTAVYTSAFTPPTAPVTAISGTSLLLNATNANVYDSAMINDMETVSNAQVSTAISKFGGSSMYFNGSTDRLQIPVTPAVYLGTTYTIEAWVYYTGASIYAARPIVSICQPFQGGFTELGLGLGTGGTINFAVRTTTNGAVTYIASSTISTNTWYHVAASVSSGSARLFIDGTQVGSTTTFAEYPISVTQYAAIGGFGHGWVDNGIPAGGWIGYIDDVRITKGVARYTSNFTPPTQSFPVF